MTAIKAGIITKSTNSELERLESEKETLEITIAKKRIERPQLTINKIRFWITKFRDTDLADDTQKLNETFSTLFFNYKDGELLVDFAEATRIVKGVRSSGGDNACKKNQRRTIFREFAFG